MHRLGYGNPDSETDFGGVVTNPGSNEKITIVDEILFPAIANKSLSLVQSLIDAGF